ncbi:hypothetical protein VTN00DRAFT_3695 [Thermoascus crustaceus]|uniref:uncharacterized protein n=1 Tax=Thermoascus crustaceus TaxID=5088 RepID=UPI003743F146
METQFETVRPTESAAVQKADKQKRLRVCSTCHRAFKRTEHWLRHERAREKGHSHVGFANAPMDGKIFLSVMRRHCMQKHGPRLRMVSKQLLIALSAVVDALAAGSGMLSRNLQFLDL